MRIAVTSTFSSWGAWNPKDLFDPESKRMIAGGETSMIHLALQLAKHGHEVILFYDTDYPVQYGGVDFLPRAYQTPLLTYLKFDVLIAWEDFDVAGINHTADLVVVPFQRNNMTSLSHYWGIDYYQAVSQWHINTLMNSDPTVMELPVRNKFVVFPNGVDMARYQGGFVPGREGRDRLRIIHSSSPDRGLHHLFNIWPEMRKAIPGVELHVFYEIKKWLESMDSKVNRTALPELSARAEAISRGLKYTEGDGVHIHGAVNQWQLAREQMQSSLLLYPCDTVDKKTEGFSITVLEGLASGTPVLTTNCDAFEELWTGVTKQVFLPVENKLYQFVDYAKELLTDDEAWQHAHVTGLQYAAEFSWNAIGNRYNSWLVQALGDKRYLARKEQESAA